MNSYAYLAAIEQAVEDLGDLSSVIQEHEALADHHTVRLRALLIQADQQAQHLAASRQASARWGRGSHRQRREDA